MTGMGGQAEEIQIGRGRRLSGEIDQRRAVRCDAAAMQAHINLEIDRHHRTKPGSDTVQHLQPEGAVDDENQLRPMLTGEAQHLPDRPGLDHGIAQLDRADTGADEHGSLGRFGHGQPDRPGRHLPPGNLNAFMGLGMWPQPHPRPIRNPLHRGDIGGEGYCVGYSTCFHNMSKANYY